MTNFEKITASPEALAEVLGSIEALTSPWEYAFCRTFCDDCKAENCDAENCPHAADRGNPLWWLQQETEETRRIRRQVADLRAEASYQENSRANFTLAAELRDAASSIEKLLAGEAVRSSGGNGVPRCD